MTGIDVHRGQVRLLQISNNGDYSYDDSEKTVKRNMEIVKFEEGAVITKVMET